MQPILYVHIPKAGGSAVNEFFLQRLGKAACLPHAENQFRGLQPDPASFSKFKFISGHLVYPNLKRHADGGDRFVMTVLREPLEQLISHIAWIRYQTEPAQRRAFHGLPDHVKALSEQLAKFDPSNADALDRFLSNLEPQNMGFFDNCQTRYLVSQVNGPIAPGMLRRAKSNLAAMDFVGIQESMQDVFDWLSYTLGLEPADASAGVNESKRKYGLDARDPAIQRVLRPFVALDQELYEHGKTLFGASIYAMWSEVRTESPGIVDRELLAREIRKRAQKQG